MRRRLGLHLGLGLTKPHLPLSGGGGGSAPEWVPDDAKIHIDFINDRAWTEAEGIVTIDTLLGDDVNAHPWSGNNVGYYPGALTAEGYDGTLAQSEGGFSYAALIGAAKTKILDEATVVVTFKNHGEYLFGALGMYMASSNGEETQAALYFEMHADSRDFQLEREGGGLPDLIISDIVNNDDAGINKLAFTLTQTRGDAAVSGTLGGSSILAPTDRPAELPLSSVVLENNQQDYVRSITIYDALPNTDGLAALSAP